MAEHVTPVAYEGRDDATDETTTSSRGVGIPFTLCPLSNLGNTCYFNAGAQLLANCTPFIYSLCNSPFRHTNFRNRTLRLRRSGVNASQELFQAFSKLMYDMGYASLQQGEALSPLRALECLAAVHPAFEGRGQQDCPEMVNVVITSLAEESRHEVDLEPLLRSFNEDAAVVTTGEEGIDCSEQAKRVGGKKPFTLKSLPQCGADAPGNEGNEFSPSSSKQTSVLSLSHPGSWWNFNVLNLMHTVNKDNELLERQEKARKEEVYQNTFCPPKLYFNSVTDCFTGYMMSEVQCHACGKTSRIVEEFSSLAVNIPSDKQRMRYARLHPEVHRVATDGSSLHQKRSGQFQWWNPFVWISAAAHWIFNVLTGFSNCVDYPITLQECLDIHFERVLLKGSNEYRCSSCDCSSEATKRESLLLLPDYLLLQMKRFNYGQCFNTKKTDPVIFPVSWDTGDTSGAEVLRLGDYLHESVVTPDVPTSPSSFKSDGANVVKVSTTAAVPAYVERTCSPYSEGQHAMMPPPIHTYTLEAVVNHHGSIGGGHYTTFARKKAGQQDIWMFLNDETISAAQLSDVADSEEYLLLYKKQSVEPRSDAFMSLRKKARSLLAIPPPEDSQAGRYRIPHRNDEECAKNGTTVYISRPWLQRLAFMEEPGPILNRLCYCTDERKRRESRLRQKQQHGQRQERTSPEGTPDHVHGPPVEWFYVPLLPHEYEAFYDMYGGNTAVTQEEYTRLRQDQLRSL
ncbi:ubiqitin hydrolase [Trypanosoma grayi]|uniref:ubiqitin hydrolase n=1 Tax=Trypanosoma grayi TaxID=71804 RepID=UPI0004F4AB24|nr:ubiqitin hydrolase [Trypanosoma grayi]KEG12934.1 ubiqitin hydrolase [Trypanosoma grayi]